MRIAWSAFALDDLASIREYIAAENQIAAAKVVQAIIDHIETQLPEWPNSGRRGRVPGSLELVVPALPYVVPCRVSEEKIEILRVYHAKRRWPYRF